MIRNGSFANEWIFFLILKAYTNVEMMEMIQKMSKKKQGVVSFFCFLTLIISCYLAGSGLNRDPLFYLSSSIASAAERSSFKKARCLLKPTELGITLRSFDSVLNSAQSFDNPYHVEAHATDIYRVFERDSASFKFEAEDISGSFSSFFLLVSDKLSTEANYLEFLRLKTLNQKRGSVTKNSLIITSDYADYLLKTKGLTNKDYDSLLDTPISVRYSAQGSTKDDQWTIFRILDSSSSSLSYLQLLYGKIFFIVSSSNAAQFSGDTLAVDFSPSTNSISETLRLTNSFLTQMKMQVSFSDYPECNYSSKALDASYSTYSLDKTTKTPGRYFLLIYLVFLLFLLCCFLFSSCLFIMKATTKQTFAFLGIFTCLSASVSLVFYFIASFLGNTISTFCLFNQFGEWCNVFCIFFLALFTLFRFFFLSFVQNWSYRFGGETALAHEEITI